MSETSKTVSTQFRHGDSLIITETTTMVKPAVIDFQDILAAVEVEFDDDNWEEPWVDQYGYEHRAVYRPRDSLFAERADVEKMRGYAWSQGNNCRVLIRVEGDDPWGVYEYLRGRGCSRQVARELAAMDRRAIVDQLVKWYEDGWYWYGVRGEYEGVEASVWGIDDDEHAERFVRLDVAREIAFGLQEKGFEVANIPPSANTANEKKTRRERLRKGPHGFDVDGPDVREARHGRAYKSFGEWFAAVNGGGVT